ncbi:hypothetical protein EY643_03890 [Halioglobus maricola]|uniref:Midcut-by-XrtH protein n=1 Tax=Halioglobus maricola TaxID=2601894 RepID=A0A5P9NGC4_9GAMM|nr:hypothetical protein [Halioglobus maricola]QFU74853.1 hypothetical protein EY643_03890 [Halioglobus maricola]
MHIRHFAIFSVLPLQLMATISHAGFAGAVTTTITATPTPPSAPDAGAMAPAVPVPVMDSVLLVAVGLLLMVVAIRFLRNSKATQKIMSIALLGTGLLLGGVGADRTVAALYTDVPIAPNCEGADIVLDGFEPSQVVNDCDTAQDIETINAVITESDDECRVIEVVAEGTCVEGLTLEPSETCTADTYNEVDSGVCG